MAHGREEGMAPERIWLAGPSGDLEALRDAPPGEPAGAALLLPGQQNDPEEAVLALAARSLAERGWQALRLRFSYGDGGPSGGNRRELGEARAALEALAGSAAGKPAAIGGKSMGGRLATVLAAEGLGISRVLVFGYPLHQMGKPERPTARDHFARLRVPTLLVCGERDPMCRPEALRAAAAEIAGPAEAIVLPEADHSLRIRKGVVPAETTAELVERAVAWLTAG
jgi:predicted alpha/beta-hydrolase family hydrolase